MKTAACAQLQFQILALQIKISVPDGANIQKHGTRNVSDRELNFSDNSAWIRMLRIQTLYFLQYFFEFGSVCDQYVRACKHDPKLAVEELFGFMDGRTDGMTDTELNDQIDLVKEDLKAKFRLVCRSEDHSDPWSYHLVIHPSIHIAQ